MKVIRTGSWNNSHMGGQLTWISWGQVNAYVRENVHYDSFRVSANHRLGLKRGQMPPGAKQVLELAAPAQFWEAIAEAVKKMDNLNRPVVRSSHFSMRWAQQQFSEV